MDSKDKVPIKKAKTKQHNILHSSCKRSRLASTWLLLLFWYHSHPNPSGWTRSAILTDKGFWLLLSSSSSGIWSRAWYLERLGTSSKFLIFYMLNLFSGTPWLLDVLNGFIAHNNVSRIIIMIFINLSFYFQHHLFFFIFDLINTFNGLFIFLLFIAKKDVLKGLQRLWRGSRDENGVKAMFSATSHVALTLSSSISSVSTVSINSQLSQTSDVSQL